MMFPWFSRHFATSRRSSRPAKRPFRPRFDVLEDRVVLSTFTWNGNGADNFWGTAANWSGPGGPGVPGTGDDLVFPGANVDPTSFSNTNDLSNRFFNSITFNNTTGSSYTLGGAAMQIGAGSISNSFVGNTINLPLSYLSSGLSINPGFGGLTLGGAVSGSGAITLGTGRLALTTSNPGFTGQMIVNGGTLAIADSGALGASGSAANGTVVHRTNTFSGHVVLEGDGLAVGAEVLTLNDFATSLENSSGTNSWAGNIVLPAGDSPRFLKSLSGQFTVSGVISSTADESGFPDLELQGAGTLVYAGGASNTHAGLTRVFGPTLVLQKSGGAQALVGALSVLIGAVRWEAGEQVGNTVPISVNNSTLNLNGFTETTGPLSLDKATITTGAGTLILNGDVTQGQGSGGSGTSTISGNLSLGSSSRTFLVNDEFPADDLVISAAIQGGSGVNLNKEGSGNLVLSGTNPYFGRTIVDQGIVAVANDSALGVGNPNGGLTSVAAGAALELRGGSGALNVATESVVLAGNGIGNGGALRNVSGNNTWGGNISLSGSQITIGVDAGTELLHTGASGDVNTTVRKVGAGRLVYAGVEAYNGDTEVAAGTLTLRGNTNAGSRLREVRVLSGATVELENRTGPIEEDRIHLAGIGFNGGGALRLSGSTATVTSPITLDADARITVEGGRTTTLTLDGVISGAAGNDLIKAGSGELVLTAANDYDGNTNVGDGVLTITNGSALGSTVGNTSVTATLAIEGSINVGESLSLFSNGGPTLQKRTTGSTAVWAGDVTFTSASTVRVDAGARLFLTGPISGSANAIVEKEGTGTLRLGGNDSNDFFFNPVDVSQGRLELNMTGGAQALQGTLDIDGGEVRYLGEDQLPDDTVVTITGLGVLNMNGHRDTLDELHIDGGNVRTGAGGAVVMDDKIVSNNTEGTPSLIDATGGFLTLLAGSTRTITVIDGPADVDLAFTGGIGGPGIIKDGAGRLEMRTPFSLPSVQVNAGVVRYVNTGGSLGNIGSTDVADGATVELSGGLSLPTSFGPLLIGNGVNGSGALRSLDGTNTLGGFTVKGNTRLAVDAGQLNGGVISLGVGVNNATNLIKDGSGTLAVTNYSLRTGSTLTVNGGAMLVNGVANTTTGFGPVPVAVAGGATLGGTGLVGAITLNGTSRSQPAVLAPGSAGPGTLTATGNVVLNSAATFTVELNGSSFDQLNLPVAASTVNLGSAALNPVLGFTPASGTLFTIINNAGTDAIQGTFAQGSTITVPGPSGNVTFGILYNGGSNGKNVVLRTGGLPPAFDNPTLTPSINEGGTVVLSGRILEEDANDTFFLDVNWGDGTVETFTFPPGSPRDVSVAHRYADNVPGGVANVLVSWRDLAGPGNSVTLTTTIANLPPVIAPLANAVSNNGILRRTLTFSDPGGDAVHATMNFGDGSPVEKVSVSGNSLTLNHRFRRKGNLRVTVTLTDKDGGTTTTTFTVRVKKAAGRVVGRTARKAEGLV